MTPAEERRFIRLWQQEANYREIAQALGCALGTVASRAAALAAQGNIQPRPRGGAYPRQKAPARPVQTPVQITALPSYPKGKAVRWNLWILDAIKEEFSARAADRDLSPSELVQEYLWKALNDQPSSTPQPASTPARNASWP